MVRLRANSIRVVEEDEPGEAGDSPAENTVSAGGVAQPDHVGAWLREARESTGRDLRDVAAHLRIRYPYLLAIEEGRFDELPGRAYVVGFIRSYSEHLGLDGEAMVARFKSQGDVRTAEQNLKFPTPAPEGRFPGTSILLVSALLVAALIGGWYYYQSRHAVELVRVPTPPAQAEADSTAPEPRTVPADAAKPARAAMDRTMPEKATARPAADTDSEALAQVEKVAEPVSPPPVMAVEPPPAPVETIAAAEKTKPAPEPSSAETDRSSVSVAAPSAEKPVSDIIAQSAAAASTAVRPAAPEPATPPKSEPVAPETSVAALPAVPVSAPSDDGQDRVYGLSNRDARVVLLAKDASWMQVLDADQNEIFTKVLVAGESYHVPNRDGLVMRVGNPSALIVSIDGAAGFPLSDDDQPISGVLLDPARLRDGTAIP